MKRRTLLFFVCYFLFLPSYALPEDVKYEPQTVRVVWVTDGDTFAFKLPTGVGSAVANLIAIEAAGWEEFGPCYALEAAMALESMIRNKDILIKWDSHDKLDRRKRYLVYVEVGGVDVNAELIKSGYGWVPRRWEADKKADYISLEKEARKAKRGIWGACPPNYIDKILAEITKHEK